MLHIIDPYGNLFFAALNHKKIEAGRNLTLRQGESLVGLEGSRTSFVSIIGARQEYVQEALSVLKPELGMCLVHCDPIPAGLLADLSMLCMISSPVLPSVPLLSPQYVWSDCISADSVSSSIDHVAQIIYEGGGDSIDEAASLFNISRLGSQCYKLSLRNVLITSMSWRRFFENFSGCLAIDSSVARIDEESIPSSLQISGLDVSGPRALTSAVLSLMLKQNRKIASLKLSDRFVSAKECDDISSSSASRIVLNSCMLQDGASLVSLFQDKDVTIINSYWTGGKRLPGSIEF